MKIVCDACSAKYSIADEKVRGKVFKIRCKKCSNIIVVRGNEDGAAAAEAPAEEPPAADGGDPNAVWHLVIDQQQVGPMTPDEVRVHLDRGEIDAESYIWREGFGDWERIADVEPFTAWFGGAAGATAVADVGGGLFGGVAASDDARTVQADPGDLFSARAAQADPGADLFGGAAAASAGSDLFGGAAAASVAADPAPLNVASSELKGQRSENSVLFSLNNLAALASDSAPRPAASSSSSASSSSGGGMAQHGGGEGSGLIDIRSMAQVYLGTEQRRDAAPAAGSIDDLPVFSQSSFEAASPVLLPTAAPAVNNRLIIMLAGLIGVLVIAAAILIIIVVKGGDKPAPAAVAQNEKADESDEGAAAGKPADEGATGAAAGAEGATPPAAEGANPQAELPATAATPEPPRAEDKPADRKPSDRTSDRRSSDRSSSSKTPDRSSSSSSPVPAAAEKPAATSTSGCDEVTCLVEPDKACCKKGKKSSGSSRSSGGSVDSSLPEKPSRSDISSGIGAVRSKVMGCSGGTGSVTAKIKISPSGSVSSVSASGGPSALNSCVERNLKGAKFPKTQKGVTVNYPFVFR